MEVHISVVGFKSNESNGCKSSTLINNNINSKYKTLIQIVL